jgi:hypothetical protein
MLWARIYVSSEEPKPSRNYTPKLVNPPVLALEELPFSNVCQQSKTTDNLSIISLKMPSIAGKTTIVYGVGKAVTPGLKPTRESVNGHNGSFHRALSLTTT